MSRIWSRIVLVAALAVLGATGAGFARAAASALDPANLAAIEGSGVPALLGPIDELGRNGWRCKPEQAAAAKDPKAADLPADDGR